MGDRCAACTMEAIERICNRKGSNRFFTRELMEDAEVEIIYRCADSRADDLRSSIRYALSYYCNVEGRVRRTRRGEYELIGRD